MTILGDGSVSNPTLSADGTSTYTVTIEDSSDASCSSTIVVGPIDSCAGDCPTPNCHTITVIRN